MIRSPISVEYSLLCTAQTTAMTFAQSHIIVFFPHSMLSCLPSIPRRADTFCIPSTPSVFSEYEQLPYQLGPPALAC